MVMIQAKQKERVQKNSRPWAYQQYAQGREFFPRFHPG